MHIKSIRVLLVGYLGIILLVTLLLSMPDMYHTNVSFLDALFTSVSAVTCTGLIVKDTALDFTIYGQIVILILIQFGGFGYMSMAGILYLIIGKKLSAQEKNLINVIENLNNKSINGVDKVVKHALFFVLSTECIGALVLSLYFSLKLHNIKERQQRNLQTYLLDS